MSFTLLPDTPNLPISSDAERIARGFERISGSAAGSDDPATQRFVASLQTNTPLHGLLSGVFGNSSFLTQCLAREIQLAPIIFEQGPDKAYDSVIQDLRSLAPDASSKDIDIALRRAKRRVALLIALADLSGTWPLERVTQRLSQFCEVALSTASSHLLRGLHNRGILNLPNPEAPEEGSGFIVLGMGKLGAHELNYSSDIYLIVLFDRDLAPAADPY